MSVITQNDPLAQNFPYKNIISSHTAFVKPQSEILTVYPNACDKIETFVLSDENCKLLLKGAKIIYWGLVFLVNLYLAK